MSKKLTIEECINAAAENNGKCLSDTYVDIKTKVKWECEYHHTWYAAFAHIKRGQWCPYCNGKHTIKDCSLLAAKRNGKCLSATYVNTNSNLTWECSFGHTWKATYDNISRGKWCPYCAGQIKGDIGKCINIAKSRGGKCLSKEYVSNDTKLEWECNLGHIWQNSYSHIKVGQWCPQCNRFSRIQTQLFDIIKDIFPGHKVFNNFCKFSWLKTKKGGIQKIDVCVPDIKVAIEYDGKQHFKPVSIFGGSKGFKDTKRRDRLKNRKIKQHPEDIKYFIRFNYTETLTTEYIIAKLRKAGVPIPTPANP